MAATVSTDRRLRSKFASKCRVCRGPIACGTTIMWAPELGARHESCGQIAATTEATSSTRHTCNCRCDGWCEDCSSFNCFATNHGRN